MINKDKIISFYYFYFIFVLSSGMFLYPLNQLLLFSTVLYLIPLIRIFSKKVSLFIIYLLLISLIILLFTYLEQATVLSKKISVFKSNLNSDSVAESVLVTTIKVSIKLFLLFIIFPINNKYYLPISKYIRIFIYLTFIQIFISTIIYNFINIDIDTVRKFYPLLSDFRPDVEVYPFVFLDEIIAGIGSLMYERPIGIFGEATTLGNFILGIYIINLYIVKKFDLMLFTCVIAILIISICKAALVTLFISSLIYAIAYIVRNKTLTILLSIIAGTLWWYLLLAIGTGYMIVRTTSTYLILPFAELTPKGFNAASWFMGYKYNLMANSGLVSMFYDLGIILSIIFYLFLFGILIKIIKINNYKNFSLYLFTYTYLIYSLLINNIYYSGIFMLLIYIFYYSLQKEISHN